MTKFTEEMKLAIVQEYNTEKISQTEYAKKVCVTKAQFQHWLKLYKLHEEEGFNTTYTNYPSAFKLDVLNYMVQSGASLMDTAALFKIKSNTANYSVESLEARIKQLEMENEYLKKLNALVQNKEKSPKKTK
ncbi:transposase [Sporosarcina sp. G11-34]|nr:transposase [Sporosarcina sp. G11-34]